jgi:hypothetical protein
MQGKNCPPTLTSHNLLSLPQYHPRVPFHQMQVPITRIHRCPLHMFLQRTQILSYIRYSVLNTRHRHRYSTLAANNHPLRLHVILVRRVYRLLTLSTPFLRLPTYLSPQIHTRIPQHLPLRMNTQYPQAHLSSTLYQASMAQYHTPTEPLYGTANILRSSRAIPCQTMRSLCPSLCASGQWKLAPRLVSENRCP